MKDRIIGFFEKYGKQIKIAAEIAGVVISMVTSYLVWILLSASKVEGFNSHATISFGHIILWEFFQPRWISDMMVPPSFYLMYRWLRWKHGGADRLESMVFIGWLLAVPLALDVFIGIGWLLYGFIAMLLVPWMMILNNKTASANDIAWFAAAVLINPLMTINGFYSGLCFLGVLLFIAVLVKKFSRIGDFVPDLGDVYALD